jgi:hypothetical protein
MVHVHGNGRQGIVQNIPSSSSMDRKVGSGETVSQPRRQKSGNIHYHDNFKSCTDTYIFTLLEKPPVFTFS